MLMWSMMNMCLCCMGLRRMCRAASRVGRSCWRGGDRCLVGIICRGGWTEIGEIVSNGCRREFGLEVECRILRSLNNRMMSILCILSMCRRWDNQMIMDIVHRVCWSDSNQFYNSNKKWIWNKSNTKHDKSYNYSQNSHLGTVNNN